MCMYDECFVISFGYCVDEVVYECVVFDCIDFDLVFDCDWYCYCIVYCFYVVGYELWFVY